MRSYFSAFWLAIKYRKLFRSAGLMMGGLVLSTTLVQTFSWRIEVLLDYATIGVFVWFLAECIVALCNANYALVTKTVVQPWDQDVLSQRIGQLSTSQKRWFIFATVCTGMVIILLTALLSVAVYMILETLHLVGE